MEQLIFNSTVNMEPLTIKAPYYNAILPTAVTFINEHTTLQIDSLGHIEFCGDDMQVLCTLDLPVHKDPTEYGHSAQYGEVKCSADGHSITLFLPIYDWEDSYPNCDGESDRWSRYIVRWFRVVYDCETSTAVVLDKEAPSKQ